MELLTAIIGLLWVATATSLVDPRGARPVEPATRSEKCATEKEWPFCTSDNWGPKCPSGCRIEGLMNRADNDLLRKMDKIRNLLEQNQANHRSAEAVSVTTYNHLRDRLTSDSGNDNNYYDLAQRLRQRITEMKISIDRQLRALGGLKELVKDQVSQMKKLEVDIDIKLRACKGSCKTYSEYSVDQESYVGLDKQLGQLDNQAPQELVGRLSVMKTQTMEQAVILKTGRSKDVDGTAGQVTKDAFPEINTVVLVLEDEGSTDAPASVSKVPGTSFSPSSPSKSITEVSGGGGFGGFGPTMPLTGLTVTSKTVSCTKTTRRVVGDTKTGPGERLEEVVEGGPECQSFDLTQGGLTSIFPSLTAGTNNVHNFGGTKGGLNPFDMGGFQPDDTEDDVPDFHARSVMGRRVQREAGYVGQGTETSE